MMMTKITINDGGEEWSKMIIFRSIIAIWENEEAKYGIEMTIWMQQ